MKCMMHQSSRRSLPSAPSLPTRNPSRQISHRNSINIITSHIGPPKRHKIVKRKMNSLKAANLIVQQFRHERTVSQPVIPLRTEEDKQMDAVLEEAKNGCFSPVKKMMKAHLKTSQRFSKLREKFKPKQDNFLSLVKNLKKEVERQEEEDEDRQLICNGPDGLINDIQESHKLLENNDQTLRKMQDEVKINWKRSIISAIESFKDYKMSSVDEFKKSVPQKPMSHPFAKEFLDSIKNNEFEKVKLMLEITPNLVYEFDARFQTGLHWAAKRGYSKIIRLLINYGSNINLKDVSGRTALWIACKYNQGDIVRILLANRANSFAKCNRRISPQEATNDHSIQQMLEKGKMVHVVMRFIPKLKRKNVLNELGLNYFIKDIQKELESQKI